MSSPVVTGSVFAGFRVVSLIGEGAMGTVYLAEDTSTGRQVALKLLARELARDERFRQRFLRESQLAASLEHPRIVPILGSGEENGVLFLAMAHVDGSDLRALLRREGRLELERALRILEQVAEALDAAHAAGLVHRDVKPGNILVTDGDDGEEACVCDFGLARHVTSVSSLTGDRGFVGTIDYVPPEQIKGGAIDGRADEYALGCVLYECLADARPFERDSELAVVYAHLNEPPPLLSDARRDLPEAFDGVIQTVLAKAPEDRYRTCGQLARAARAASRGKILARRKPRLRRALLAAALVFTAAAAAAVAGVLASRGSQATPTISETAMGGLALGASDSDYEGAWGPSSIGALKYPEDYAKRTFGERKVAVYFASGDIQGAIRNGDARVVEITTWNESDQTEAGVGPCSTVAELKTAYGGRLKPVPGNIIKGKVYGYTVGNKLFFGVGPLGRPTHVGVVAVYANPLQYAGFNALSEASCA